MSKRWDVLGFGAIAVDELLYLDEYPTPDTKVTVREATRQGGGLTATALVAVARLGGRPAFAGVLGDDELSRYSIRELEREGVDCSQVLRHPGARPFHSTIIVDRSTGQRTILRNPSGLVERRPEEITEDMIAAGRVLFVDHTVLEGSLRAAEIARAGGIPVVGDVESLAAPGVAELMRRIDHLIVGSALAGQATGETDPAAMVAALMAATRDRKCCVVTAGDQGCWYAERGGEVRHVPALAVKAVDTTGCGDVFHGAYALCLARELGLDQAVRAATVAAGLKATRPGGRTGIPTWDVVERHLLTI